MALKVLKVLGNVNNNEGQHWDELKFDDICTSEVGTREDHQKKRPKTILCNKCPLCWSDPS